MNTLKDSLKETHDKITASMPEKAAIFDADTNALVDTGIANGALKVGQTAPEFSLPNQVGEPIVLTELLKEGHVVISFYRGSWCPYCNLELRALQQLLPKFNALGANLVAISPQMPDESMSTSEKNDLTFSVLSDMSNKVARAFGLVFTLTPDLYEMYASFGNDLETLNGDKSHELPIPGTFVIAQDGTITAAQANADYKVRMEPQEILDTLVNMNK
jgi:peroxiredoxin